MARTFVRGRELWKQSCMAAGLLCVFLAPAVSAQEQAPWPSQAKDFRLHMVGNAHIDPVWLWPWAEGVSEIHSTFRSALDRMNEDPELVMTASSAQFYEWVAENDPAMLAEIRKRVEEGRWDLVGGWWVEPDVNIPNGESLARQGLYGQETYKRLFGQTAKVGYNPDSFGHPGSLPQILKLQGMEDYAFQRPGVNEKKLPSYLFWWKGIDGSRVLSYRIPISYTDWGSSVEPRMRSMVKELSPGSLRDAMEFFGVGDHGGGPTKASMASIRKIQSEPAAPKIFYSSPDRYFAEIRRERKADIPVVDDELQHHSVGCYTAEWMVKKGNREAEAKLTTAEKISAVGSVAWGAHYPMEDFIASWKRVLFMQFHDSLAGTALPEHYKTSREAQGRAIDVAEQAMYLSAQRLAWQVPTEDVQSKYLFVFNPHPWATTQVVERDLELSGKDRYEVKDDAGHSLRFQWVQATTVVQEWRRIAVEVNLPAFGYRQIRIVKAPESDAAPSNPLKVTSNSMENEHLRVTFSKDGRLGIFDKDAGREVFRGGETGVRAVVLNDQNDTWAHNVAAYTDELGEFKQDSVKLVESGPLRARLRVHSVYGKSSLTTDWSLYAGSRKLEAQVELDWHEHMKILKLSFPVDADNPKATYEIPYGAVVRATKGDEEPGQRWIDVAGDRGKQAYGLSVINDAKYGYSVNGSDMRVSITRGAVYANHMPEKLDPGKDYQWQDQGVQTFRMILVPHTGLWQDADVVHTAEELMAPPLAVYQGIHRGTRPQSDSFVAVSAPNIVISAIKKAEDDNGLIVRMYEAAGRQTSANLDLRFAKLHWKGEFRPFEIKTLRVNSESGAVSEINILER
ncbi:MAG: glycoside hydrolase family 38 C-terminal domain-containing protein [Terracidiphilus sp.]|nr:glycoside hydrolase family 38 C-terminal domain-containing protein [Terracidiphilus sp.]